MPKTLQRFLIALLCGAIVWGGFWVADKIVRPLWEDAEPY